MAKQKGKQHPWADRTLLQGPYLTLCLTEKQLNAACQHIKVEEDWDSIENGVTIYYRLKDKNCCIVVIKGHEDVEINAVLGLIVHEAVHVWQYARNLLGEKSPGKEQEAYAIQNIAQELFILYDRLIKEV